MAKRNPKSNRHQWGVVLSGGRMSELGKSGEVKQWSMETLTQEIVGLNNNRDIFPEDLIFQRERAIKEQIGLFGWTSAGDMLKDVNTRQDEVGQSSFKKQDLKGFF